MDVTMFMWRTCIIIITTYVFVNTLWTQINWFSLEGARNLATHLIYSLVLGINDIHWPKINRREFAANHIHRRPPPPTLLHPSNSPQGWWVDEGLPLIDASERSQQKLNEVNGAERPSKHYLLRRMTSKHCLVVRLAEQYKIWTAVFAVSLPTHFPHLFYFILL